MNRIDNYYAYFTVSEKKIADYLLANAENAVRMSIIELADEIGVAASSLTRFARRIDYHSFNEMRLDLAKQIDSSSISDFEKVLSWNASPEGISRQFIDGIQNACRSAMELNNMKKFEDAARIIDRAEVVYLFGVGASSLIAQDLEQKLMKMRKRCVYNLDGNIGKQNAILASPKDVVIAVSYGGGTEEVNQAVQYAHRNACPVIGITRFCPTALSDMSDICLYTPNVEKIMRIASIFSRYAQMFIVDVLFMQLARITKEDPAKTLSEYRELSPVKE